MANNLYIEHAQVVNFDSIQDDTSIFIENGIIKYIGKELDFPVPKDCRRIDARGKFILPGGIDPHTHFELEFGGCVSVDDFYHGTKAAVAGGTTTIIDFVIPKKGESLLTAYDKWRKRADPKVVCDFGFHCAITWWNSSVCEEMEILCNEKGISSFKMFMAYKVSTIIFMVRNNKTFSFTIRVFLC